MNFIKVWPEIEGVYEYYLLPALFVLCGLLTIRFLSKSKLNLPPGPTGLPLVGYLPFIGKEPFKSLDRLRRKYGNVFSLYLGQTYVVVLGDYPAVKEAFSKAATLNRPPRMFSFIPDGGGVAGASGEEWVEQRRFMLRVMKDIGLGRSKWAHLVEDNVSDLVKLISSKKGHAIDFEECLTDNATDNITALVFGKRLEPGPHRTLLISATKTVTQFFSQTAVWMFFPSLCNLLVKLKIGSTYKAYCEMKAFNAVIRKEVDRRKKSSSDLHGADFISDYIATMQNVKDKSRSVIDRNFPANARSLFIGGSETVTTAITWLFLTMAAYPDVQKKVQAELDSFLGKQHRATWEDRLKFPYSYSVILETHRWKTVVPLNVARMTVEDIKVCGYDIPKGTTIIANNWGLHNDPRYWKEPEKFMPERFLQNGTSEVDVKKESFVPFSYGKRTCLGENVAMIEMFLYFTAIMQAFDIRAPYGGQPKMDAILGISYQPVSQKLCFVPRKKNIGIF